MDFRTWTIFAILLGLMMVAGMAIAHAEYAPTYRSSWWSGYAATPCEECARAHEIRRRQRERARREREREDWEYRNVRRATIYRESERDDSKCRPAVSVVGDQYASESGARSEADKSWMGTVRWIYGERYLDRENARDASYECGRSSVGSVVGQVFYRCRITARPCSPEKQGGK